MAPLDLFTLDRTDNPLRFSWRPSSNLLTPAYTLQGGAGLGAATAALTAVTGRTVIWATAQYLSFASGLDPLDIEVTVEVAGHNTTQARCVVSRHGVEVLTAHAALGSRPLGFEAVWCRPPAVAAPEACPHYRFFERGKAHLGEIVEMRLAHGKQLDQLTGQRGDGSFALWIRVGRGTRQMTVPELAFIGDFMPLGYADALGEPFAGNSLDNTIRVGHLVETEWVLLAVQVQQVVNGFGYGRAELWAQDGTLLGEVSQNSVMRIHRHIREKAERTPDLTQLDLTQLDLTQLDLTQLDLTQLDLTQLDLTQASVRLRAAKLQRIQSSRDK